MAVKEREKFRYLINSFAGGENTKVDGAKIGPSELQKCLEYLMDDVGNLIRRAGNTSLNIDTGGEGIHSLIPFHINDGTKKLIIATEGFIKKLNGVVLASLGSGYTSGARWNGDTYNDRLYLCNGDDSNIVIEDDDTIRNAGCVAPTVKPTVAENGAGTPNGDYYWSYTFVYPWGESSESPSSDLLSPVDKKVLVTLGEVFPTGATGAYIYRTIDAGTSRLKLTYITAPTDEYDDNLGDGALGIEAPSDNSAPRKSRLSKEYKNYMYYIDDEYPYRLYWAILGFPEIVYTDSFDEIFKKDGRDLVALEYTLNPDYFIIFKEDSIHRYTGTSPFTADDDTLVLDTLSTTVGTLAPRSVIRIGSDIFFFGSDRKIYSLQRLVLAETTSLEPVALSDRIEDVLKDNINVDRIPYFHGFYYDNKYLLFVATKNSSSENMVIIVDLLLKKKPIVRAFPIASMSSCIWYDSSDMEIPVLGASSNSQLMQFLNGTTDLGTIIHAEMKTKRIDLSQPFNRKIWERTRVLLRTSRDYSFDIKAHIVKKGTTKTKTKSISGAEDFNSSSTIWGEGTWNSGSLWGADSGFSNVVIDLQADFYIGMDGETLEIEIYNVSAGATFIIKGIEVEGWLMRARP